MKLAGFSKQYFPRLNEIILVSEPEAAALSVLKSVQEDEGHNFFQANLLKSCPTADRADIL
jgi:hypothetical protein